MARSSPQAKGRHGADPVSLVSGLILVGIALGWLLISTGVLRLADLGWAIPVLLIGSGLAGVLVSRKRRQT